jgi:exopolysaccharide production protein ExoQ
MIVSQNKFRPEPALAGCAILALVATSVFGTFAALTFIILSSALFLAHPKDALRSVVRFLPLFILPVLAALSTIWSDAPPRTLRAALQLSVTVGSGIVAFRQLDPRKTIALLFLGFLAVAVFALPYVPQALSSGRAMTAFFDSKNALAFNAVLLFALGLGSALDPVQHWSIRFAGLLSLPLACLIIYLCQSASATTSIALLLVTMPSLVALGRMNQPTRIALVALLVLTLAVALLFLPEIEAAIGDLRGNVLKKDATLTGRTYLWQVAGRLTAERPWLGHGYGAFWRLGNLDAEALWRWGGIANRSGFNFHNAYIEMGVDLGLFGQFILYASCAVIAVLGALRQVLRPSAPIAFFLSLQIVVYIRSYAETGLIAPFSLLTILWVGTAVYAVSLKNEDEPVELADLATSTNTRTASRRAKRAERIPRGVSRTGGG